MSLVLSVFHVGTAPPRIDWGVTFLCLRVRLACRCLFVLFILNEVWPLGQSDTHCGVYELAACVGGCCWPMQAIGACCSRKPSTSF